MNLRMRASKWFTGRRPATTTSPRCRLGVEGLEDRVVPTIFPRYAIPVVPKLSQQVFVHRLVPAGNFSLGNGYGPQLTAAADFNRDGKPDLFVTKADGTYGVLLGTGNGGFNLGTNGPLVGLANPEGVVAGDFNHDGKADVAVAGFGDANTPGAVAVFLGRGDGTFAYGSSLQNYIDYDNQNNPRNIAPTYLATADLNRDGNLDLVVADYNNNKVVIYTGDGGGGFAVSDYNYDHPGAPDGVLHPDQIVVADFNRDGLLDVAVTNKGDDFNTGSVTVFAGQGNGTIYAAYVARLSVYGSVGLAAGDLDGDGRVDLAVANYGTNAQGAQTVTVLRNLGAGGGFDFATPVNVTVGDHVINVAIGDFNGDGRLDLAVSSAGNTEDYNAPPDNRVIVLYNQGGGTFGLNSALTLTAGLNPVGLTAVDLNGDGRLDLVSVNQNSNDVSVFLDTAFPAY